MAKHSQVPHVDVYLVKFVIVGLGLAFGLFMFAILTLVNTIRNSYMKRQIKKQAQREFSGAHSNEEIQKTTGDWNFKLPVDE